VLLTNTLERYFKGKRPKSAEGELGNFRAPSVEKKEKSFLSSHAAFSIGSQKKMGCEGTIENHLFKRSSVKMCWVAILAASEKGGVKTRKDDNRSMRSGVKQGVYSPFLATPYGPWGKRGSRSNVKQREDRRKLKRFKATASSSGE